MNNIQYKEIIKDISIKLLLTIPALAVGIFSAILFILKPLFELWFPKQTDFERAAEIALQQPTETDLKDL